MLRYTLIPLLLSQSGCDVVRSLKGTWLGTCTFRADLLEEDDIDVNFGLDIRSDDGSVIQGVGMFDFKGLTFEGRLSGDRFDQEVTLVLEGGHEGESVRLEIMGEFGDEQIDGSCMIYGVEGNLSMVRRASEE
jgi:hypothetical protein